MVARLDAPLAAAAIPVRFRETARELLSETWSSARAIDNAWHTTFAELESCRAELLAQTLRSQQEQLRLDQLRTQLTAEHFQAVEDREQEITALRNTVVELQEQRTILEMELENARQQSAQLTAEVTELRQQQALDREGVQAELRQLRLAVERPWPGLPAASEYSHALVETQFPPEIVLETPVIDASAATPAPPVPEPGLDSVLNHFQALQKDLARRRGQPKGAKPSA